MILAAFSCAERRMLKLNKGDPMGRIDDVPAEIQAAAIIASAQIIAADTEADKEEQISISKPEAVTRLAIEILREYKKHGNDEID
jgi:hypothetical protein